MQTITKPQFDELQHVHLMQIKEGAVFVYPTDTIYGIGCDARNPEAVKRIRSIKKRTEQPFSAIAPSKDWILENCELNESAEEFLDKLPGAYTLLLKIKNKDCVAKEVTPTDVLGVRIPKHWISEVAAELEMPIVTTSVNVTGESHIIDVAQMNEELCEQIDFAIDECVLKNEPSEVYDLTKKEPKKLR